MKQDESQGCVNTNNYKGARPIAFDLEGGCSEEGIKRDKISNKNHPKTINTFHTIHI